MFAHLHVRSWFSFQAGGASPEKLAARAAALGMKAVALTDVNGVYGAVRFQKACRLHGIKPIIGAEVHVEDGMLVLLARSAEGYANLCRLLTRAHLRDRDAPTATLDELRDHAADLHALTGTRGSRLWRFVEDRRADLALGWLEELAKIFGEHLSIEVAHHEQPGDTLRADRLSRLAEATGIPLLATGDVRYALRDDYRLYDLLTCVRLGITVFEPHPERPQNAQAFLKDEAELRRLLPYPAAFARAEAVAAGCDLNLVPEHLTPPAARVPEGTTARAHLVALCYKALPRFYPPERRARAEAQLRKELGVISGLELDGFFLVVHEVVVESRRRGIRCAGRGSAANSLVAYLLGITAVDPIAHRLLFERFLHGGRKGTPDIDVDFDSDRRGEIIAWMEERFGEAQTAMTANVITYRLRSALRDAAKALGWPLETVNKLSKAVEHRSARHVRDYRVPIEGVLGRSPLLEVLLDSVEGMHECPRHLGQHSGGMVLSSKPLFHFTPIQRSANGVKVTQFDKDDTEALGLVKFDVLALRMLACISEAVELIHRHIDPDFDLDSVPLDDVPTFNMIRASDTMATFQIESQGQLHLLARNQVDCFEDLIAEIALFRPGPVQGNMVNPFVRRRRGMEPVQYDHPDLEPILKDTFGIILFQEQNLEIAHHFAGMSLEEADEFRRLMSKYRNREEMEKLRGRFVAGAVGRGVDPEIADKVFNHVSFFVGYGFCRSHAAAFAKTVYQSCYLKRHYTAAYMAAFMQHRPGMYDLMTLEQDARRFRVPTLLPEVNQSGTRYDIERTAEGRWAIRKPLAAVAGMSADDARAVFMERLRGPFESVEDLYRRVNLDVDLFKSLAQSGAMDALAGGSRRALWQVGLLARRNGRPGEVPQPSLFDLPVFTEADLPSFPALGEAERLRWDYRTHGAGRSHPMTLLRRQLGELEIRTIDTCWKFGRAVKGRPGGLPPILTVAGLSILRQRPPTAKGVLFVTIEDETGFIQCVVRPEALERMDHVIRSAALIVRGQLLTAGNWRGLVVTDAWRLDGIFGGYEGHPSQASGRDRLVLSGDSGGGRSEWGTERGWCPQPGRTIPAR